MPPTAEAQLQVIRKTAKHKDDPAFQHPTKPIGKFYTREEAERIQREKGFVMVEDAGRGYRRVVPSPRPVKIIEIEVAGRDRHHHRRRRYPGDRGSGRHPLRGSCCN